MDSEKINALVQKIKHYLITNVGKVAEQASIEEFYYAFITSLREEIMINWITGLETIKKNQSKVLYYLSMEYLPGRYLGNNISNVGASDIIQEVIKKMGRNYSDLIHCEPDPGLGNGGLGRLASCFLDSLSTQHFPYYAYGLRYQYGIFDQEIWDGNQVERPDCWLLNQNPWEFRKDTESCYVHFHGKEIEATNTHKEQAYILEDFEEVRALPYDVPIIGYSSKNDFSVGTLRLFSTKESPRNFELQKYNAGRLDEASENTSLTDVLYPNDNHEVGKRIRLKQEFLLVSASLQDIIRRHNSHYGDMTNFADKVRIQINDTHPALVTVELIRRLLKYHDFTWDKALETTQACCSYTNHTVLKEALEEWNEERIQYLLPRQYRLIQKINQQFCSDVRQKFPEEKVKELSIIENGQIKMANLSIFCCHKVNGVAKLHTEILKSTIFKDFFKLYPEKFINVTNGVTQRRWLLSCNPKLSNLITTCIGDDWIYDFSQIEKLKNYVKDSNIQQQFLEIKKENKQKLIDFLQKENPVRDAKGKILSHCPTLDTSALIDAQIKRIHEYKRPLLNALHIIILYLELKQNPNARKIKRISLIGGKAAPGYHTAKRIIRLFHCMARKINQDPDTNQKLILTFVENYNVSKAEIIIPATDLSEQISTAGMEASGTGNMKLSMNGALTIGTDDGANVEMREAVSDAYWPFLFGSSCDEISKLKADGNYNPSEIYHQNPKIKQALDALCNRTFATTDSEHEDFCSLYNGLLQDHGSMHADRYFVLKDLSSYYETQLKVEDLYSDPIKWAEYALYNIACMGNFSTDQSISNYASKIWQLEKCLPDDKILEEVRSQYAEHDRCRIIKD